MMLRTRVFLVVVALSVTVASVAVPGAGQVERIRIRPMLFGVPNTAFIYPSDTVRPVTSALLGQALWYSYQAYLWDAAAGQLRPGAADLIAALSPGLVGHYPGVGVLAHDFEWKRVIGPLSRRSDPTPRERTFDTPLGATFGPDEYGRMLEQLRNQTGTPIGGSIEVNVVSGSAEDAADWVEYMNAPNDGSNPGGGTDWAAVRAANGHPAPYNIHYWELGNEPSYTAGYGTMTAWEYIARIKSFVPAMKSRDSSIEVTAYVNAFSVGSPAAIGTASPDVAAGPSPDGRSNNLTWTQAIIQNAGSLIDILHFHWFGAWNTSVHTTNQIETSALTGFVPWLERLQQDISNFAPDDTTKSRLKQHVAIAEWNSFGGFSNPLQAGTAMLGAVADSRIVHVLTRRPEIVYASRLALAGAYPDPPINTIPALVDQLDVRAGYFGIWTRTDGSAFVQTAVHQLGKLWARALLARAVRADAGSLPSSNGVSMVDVSAFANTDSSQVNLVITNASDSTVTLSCVLDKYSIAGNATTVTLKGANLQDNNSYAEPTRVQLQEQTVVPSGPGQVIVSIPAQSVLAVLLRGRTSS